MTVKTIKNVDERVWREFKTLAAQEKQNMGTLLKKLVDEYKKENQHVWDNLLNHGRIISEIESKKLLRAQQKLRKESTFRI